ncbi:hypothetical protein FQN57_004606 [Myotisia sp. PD_48]|nr:hypothetical protein FQN57_004606 [Myotisia sp. PD_48]
MATPMRIANSPFSFRIFSSSGFPPRQQHQICCVRYLHKSMKPAPVPSPTPFVPDTQTFLSLIGRNMSRFAPKLTDWNQLFTISPSELQALGMETPRDRKYLLRWREKFRRQDYGVGGDFDHVVDGVAELRAIELPLSAFPKNNTIPSKIPESKDELLKDVNALKTLGTATQTPGMRFALINIPPGKLGEMSKYVPSPLKRYAHYKLHSTNMIKGPYVQVLKDAASTGAQVKVQEGMWEDKRGVKIDGGQRRQAEIRAKRRLAERKAARAA